METQEKQKKYVLVGAYLTGKRLIPPPAQRFVSAKELVDLYGIDPEECYFGDERIPASWFGQGKVFILWPRERGDYKEYLALLLKNQYEFSGGLPIKRARKKTRFNPREEWARQLKRRGKL